MTNRTGCKSSIKSDKNILFCNEITNLTKNSELLIPISINHSDSICKQIDNYQLRETQPKFYYESMYIYKWDMQEVLILPHVWNYTFSLSYSIYLYNQATLMFKKTKQKKALPNFILSYFHKILVKLLI